MCVCVYVVGMSVCDNSFERLIDGPHERVLNKFMFSPSQAIKMPSNDIVGDVVTRDTFLKVIVSNPDHLDRFNWIIS